MVRFKFEKERKEGRRKKGKEERGEGGKKGETTILENRNITMKEVEK